MRIETQFLELHRGWLKRQEGSFGNFSMSHFLSDQKLSECASTKQMTPSLCLGEFEFEFEFLTSLRGLNEEASYS